MDEKYVSEKKFERAVKALKEAGKEPTDEAVMELYKLYGGAIKGEPETYRGVPDVTDTEKNMLLFLAKEAGVDIAGLKLKDVAAIFKRAFAKKK